MDTRIRSFVQVAAAIPLLSSPSFTIFIILQNAEAGLVESPRQRVFNPGQGGSGGFFRHRLSFLDRSYMIVLNLPVDNPSNGGSVR